MIIAGHGRVQAANTLGINKVPTICLENLSEDQIRAYVLADNKLAENAGWDESILAIELQHLVTVDLAFMSLLPGLKFPKSTSFSNNQKRSRMQTTHSRRRLDLRSPSSATCGSRGNIGSTAAALLMSSPSKSS
jgi:hypothetical protein